MIVELVLQSFFLVFCVICSPCLGIHVPSATGPVYGQSEMDRFGDNHDTEAKFREGRAPDRRAVSASADQSENERILPVSHQVGAGRVATDPFSDVL